MQKQGESGVEIKSTRKVWSNLLGEAIWVVADVEAMETLALSMPVEVIYTANEIAAMKDCTPEAVVAVHATKKIFPGSRVVVPQGAVTVPVEDTLQVKTRGEVIDMRHHDRFPPNFLGQKDFEEARVLTIERVGEEEIKGDNGPVSKYVIRFEEIEDKGFVLNSINSQKIEKMYGDDDEWIGKQIELYTDPDIVFGNKVVGGVRVRRPSQPAPQEEAPF